ncbi:type II toxin-antitoxin system RelE/ParE family toxin [Imperialibacter roseus]|uniref:Type II toxin-antitoxin system RelE/ParE family toxin n=1 Tax=Imperialibacter roseus TaxID=1324217 RepID=A0ABZ0IUQ5_9BACT|nr:type II toxin-antitoxin system RelE/ParE family toxin [Imperialibacter roseus]WOK08120.1 type II toxin-antitoxin system RelE/ParE family toxin [Imperialibacter roseus]
MQQKRQLVFFKHHFRDFFEPLSDKLKDKIDQVLFLIRIAERIPTKFFKHLTGTDGLFEIRVEFQSNIYRIFCCFDEGNLVVLFNGFQKKSRKTPKNEIDKALMIKDEYFELKSKSK